MAAQGTMIIRFGIHSFLPVGKNDKKWIWVAAIGEMFKGLNFGLMQAAGVMVASNEAPPELQATAQGFFAGVYQGNYSICIALIFRIGAFFSRSNWIFGD